MAGRVNQRNESSIITIIVYIANSTALATVFTRFNQNNKQTNQPTSCEYGSNYMFGACFIQSYIYTFKFVNIESQSIKLY